MNTIEYIIAHGSIEFDGIPEKLEARAMYVSRLKRARLLLDLFYSNYLYHAKTLPTQIITGKVYYTYRVRSDLNTITSTHLG